MIKLSASVSKKVPLPEVEYSSHSCCAGAEVEVSDDASPRELRDRLRALYGMLEEAVDEQLQGNGEPVQRKALSEGPGNGLSKRAGGNGNGRMATDAQVRVILEIAAEHGLSEEQLEDVLREQYGADTPAGLSIKDASAVIDLLKNGREPRE